MTDNERQPSRAVDLLEADVAREPGSARLRPVAAEAVRAFAADVHRLLATDSGNLVSSPYSIAIALAMTRNGAAGATAQEMDAVLHIDDLAEHNAGLNALTRAIEGMAGEQTRADGTTAELTLDTANSLWGQRGVEWEQDFLDALARHFGAGMRAVDYVEQTEQARSQINRWTATRTRDRIDEIVPAGAIDNLTRLVLVNAIYLKAPWEKPFEPNATRPAPFRRADGTTVRVDTMHETLPATSYGRGDGWQAARLPYAGGRLAMTVVLPDDPELASFEQSLDGNRLADLVTTTGHDGGPLIALSMPKWKFRLQSPLNQTLQKLGMRLAFTDDADLSGMSAELDLLVSAVLHEAFIAVDEEGTEAAAATAVVVSVTSLPVTEPLTLDRPFLFVIHDVEHSTPLFIGRVDDPSLGSD